MKLFISWSGEFSKKVAECLSIWIPTIIQTVDVFYSPNDIAKGENWSSRLSDELEQSNFGIVCLTPENISAPWIHFEAGALSKVASSRVSAIMLEVSPSDVKGPLARFQNTAFNREDFYRLFLSINSSHENPLKQAVLDHAFDNSWEKLEHDITSILEEYTSRSPAPISEKLAQNKYDSNSEAIQEILSIVRTLDNSLNTSSLVAPSPSVDNMSKLNDSFPKTLHLLCPHATINDVLPLIRKYDCTPFSKLLESPEKSLINNGDCYISIRSDQIPAFILEAQKFGVKVHVL